MSNEKKKTHIKIIWPDLDFPPINLSIITPAWFYKSTQKERESYLDFILNRKEEKNETISS